MIGLDLPGSFLFVFFRTGLGGFLRCGLTLGSLLVSTTTGGNGEGCVQTRVEHARPRKEEKSDRKEGSFTKREDESRGVGLKSSTGGLVWNLWLCQRDAQALEFTSA